MDIESDEDLEDGEIVDDVDEENKDAEGMGGAQPALRGIHEKRHRTWVAFALCNEGGLENSTTDNSITIN